MSRSESAYHHGALAEALIQAAIELLAEGGSPALSLRAVARHADVSHNAPYHHFGDRQGLLQAVAARGLEEMHAAMDRARQGEEEPAEQLLALCEAYIDFAREHRALFEIVFDPEICDPRSPSPATTPLIDANQQLLAEVVGRTVSHRADPGAHIAELAPVLWGTAHGLATLVAAGHLERDAVIPGLRSLLLARLDD